MAQLHVRGARLEFSEDGRGHPLILIHGSSSDHRTWDHLTPEFGRHYRTIRYSRRYHWPNDRIVEGADYSMAEQVDDLEAVLHEVGAVRAHVVAHSYGAYLALLLAIRSPSSLGTLVLAEPPVVPLLLEWPPTPAGIVRLLLRRPRTAATVLRFGALGMGPATAALRRGDRERCLRLLATTILGRQAFERLSEERLAQARDNLIDAELLGSGFAPVDDDDVRRIRHPTLLLGGERSPRIFRYVLDRLQELMPAARRAEIPDASHIMHEDAPDAFFDTVMGFLEPSREAD